MITALKFMIKCTEFIQYDSNIKLFTFSHLICTENEYCTIIGNNMSLQPLKVRLSRRI